MKFSGLLEEEVSRNSDIHPRSGEERSTQLMSEMSDARHSLEAQVPSLILKKKDCKIKPLLILGGVELFNTGPDFNVFLPTFIVFVIVLNAITLFVRNVSTDNVLRSAILYINLTQNIAYMLAGFGNPGVVRANERIASTSEELFFCSPCGIYTRPSTQHCTYCNACIRNYDHHCPWVGKCIGRGNIVSFFVFVVSTMLAMLVSMISLLMAIAAP